MSKEYVFIVKKEDENLRLDKYLSSKINDFSRSFITKNIEQGNIKVNLKTVNKNYKVATGDQIVFFVIKKDEINLFPQNLNINILYEEKDLFVVEKPKGMVMYPTNFHRENTLANGLLALNKSLSNIGGKNRPGIVHRLDKDTSGIVIIAKNNETHLKLIKQMKKREILRQYHAIIKGIMKKDDGVINKQIGRSTINRTQMSTTSNKLREAKTFYKVLNYFNDYTYIEITLETGRKHQIRVHFNSIGHPLAGEKIYNNNFFSNSNFEKKDLENTLDGQCLHAKTLEFTSPRSEKKVLVTSELPSYFTNFLKNI